MIDPPESKRGDASLDDGSAPLPFKPLFYPTVGMDDEGYRLAILTGFVHERLALLHHPLLELDALFLPRNAQIFTGGSGAHRVDDGHSGHCFLQRRMGWIGSFCAMVHQGARYCHGALAEVERGSVARREDDGGGMFNDAHHRVRVNAKQDYRDYQYTD